jgi:hypothetical protein
VTREEPQPLVGWRRATQIALLASGIASAVLYVASDVLVSVRDKEFVYWHQHISELMAVGSPTRTLALPLFLATSVLLLAFGVGLWRERSRKRSLRIAGAMLVGAALVGLAVPLFAPMSMRGAEQGLTGQLHLVGTAANVLFILLAMGFGAAALGPRFRIYSILTIVVLLAFGAWVAGDAAAVEAGLATPWSGLKERVNIYGFQLWIVVLATILVRHHVAQVLDRGSAERHPTRVRGGRARLVRD